MPGADELCGQWAVNVGFIKGDAFVLTWENVRVDSPRVFADLGRNVRKLVSPGLCFAIRAAEATERLQKEATYEVRLQPARVSPFHFGADLIHIADVHRV